MNEGCVCHDRGKEGEGMYVSTDHGGHGDAEAEVLEDLLLHLEDLLAGVGVVRDVHAVPHLFVWMCACMCEYGGRVACVWVCGRARKDEGWIRGVGGRHACMRRDERKRGHRTSGG